MRQPNEPIRVGVAGLGRAGWDLHVAALTKLPEQYRIVAVCDTLPERRAEAAERLDCCAYADFAELLADTEVELAVVATFSHLHAPMSIEALRAGKHVMVEKPFATSLADADRMIAAAQETGRVLTCHQNTRYAPDTLKVQELLASGKLGRIVEIRIAWQGFGRRWDWQTLKAFGGGALNNTGSHALDLALLLLGDAEPEVFCRMERTPLCSGDAEDHVKVILQPKDGPTVDVEVTSASAFSQEPWQILGTNGGLTGTRSQLRWKYLPPDLPPRPVDANPTPDRSYNRETLPWIEETWEATEGIYPQATQKIYRDLYPAIREGAPVPITLASLRRQSALLQRCRDLSPV
jgi:predicted dehydrogenase